MAIIKNARCQLNLKIAVTWSHKILENEISNVATCGLSGNLIKGKMNSAVNAAAIFFIRHRREADIGACRAARSVPRMLKRNIVASKNQARIVDCEVPITALFPP